MTSRLDWIVLGALGVGIVGCAIGIAVEGGRFYAAWLCAYLFWLGLPLGALALVLVHDLTGGGWMASARPALNAAIATMPLATLAGILAFVGLHALYPWLRAPGLANRFYLNTGFFLTRYAADLVAWNAAAAYALWLPRGLTTGIAPALSWISAVGLLLLAFTASFAAIDWVLSLDPHFWSAIFPMIVGAGWFDTGLALVLIVVACGLSTAPGGRHMADLAMLLLAMVIFWAYVEFCQFLIVWEANLASEIPWYLRRIAGGWRGVTWLVAIAGFGVPFLILLWGPAKRNRIAVTAACGVILFGQLLHSWWLVLPELAQPPSWWLDIAAMLALSSGMSLLFLRQLRRGAPTFATAAGEAR